MITGVIAVDPWLSPFKDALKRRFSKTNEWIKKIEETEGSLDKFSQVSFQLPSRGVWCSRLADS